MKDIIFESLGFIFFGWMRLPPWLIFLLCVCLASLFIYLKIKRESSPEGNDDQLKNHKRINLVIYSIVAILGISVLLLYVVLPKILFFPG